MSLEIRVPRASVAGKARARAELVDEPTFRRFRPPHAARVRALAARHGALADLSFSFPALLFALASSRDAAAAWRGVVAAVGQVARCASRGSDCGAADVAARAAAGGVRAAASAVAGRLAVRAARRQSFATRGSTCGRCGYGTSSEAARWGDEVIAGWVAQEFARAPRKAESGAAQTWSVCGRS